LLFDEELVTIEKSDCDEIISTKKNQSLTIKLEKLRCEQKDLFERNKKLKFEETKIDGHLKKLSDVRQNLSKLAEKRENVEQKLENLQKALLRYQATLTWQKRFQKQLKFARTQQGQLERESPSANSKQKRFTAHSEWKSLYSDKQNIQRQLNNLNATSGGLLYEGEDHLKSEIEALSKWLSNPVNKAPSTSQFIELEDQYLNLSGELEKKKNMREDIKKQIRSNDSELRNLNFWHDVDAHLRAIASELPIKAKTFWKSFFEQIDSRLRPAQDEISSIDTTNYGHWGHLFLAGVSTGNITFDQGDKFLMKNIQNLLEMESKMSYLPDPDDLVKRVEVKYIELIDRIREKLHFTPGRNFKLPIYHPPEHLLFAQARSRKLIEDMQKINPVLFAHEA
jgi:DNA repair exonuclease SbcCD ATPase subunit